jgi:glycosyltransferase involved in cell wall biosynthesis
MSGHRISAIVCVGRETRFLAGTLESIVRQSRPVDEITVVHTADATRELFEILDQFPVHRIVQQPEPGLAAARNHGVEVASGDVIAFLDADDIWPVRKTALQTACLARAGEAVAGRLLRVRDESVGVDEYPPMFFKNTHPAVTPGGLMATRAAIHRAGPFDTAYKLACDHDWVMRLRNTVGIEMNDELVLYKRIHSRALSRNMYDYRRELMMLLRDSAVT